MSDEPIFYSKNYVNSNCDITVTSGDAVKYRLYDKDNISVWRSAGQSSNGDMVTIDIRFNENGVSIGRYITDLFIQNTNFSYAYVSFLTSAGWAGYELVSYSNDRIYPESMSVLNWTMHWAVPSTYANQLVYGIKFYIDEIRLYAGGEKEIGEIWALNKLLTMSRTPDKSTISLAPVALVNRSMNGDTEGTPIQWAGDKVLRWSAKLTFSFITAAIRTLLLDIVKLDKFVIWPEPITTPNEIYNVSSLDKTLDSSYMDTYKTAGYSISLEMREI